MENHKWILKWEPDEFGILRPYLICEICGKVRPYVDYGGNFHGNICGHSSMVERRSSKPKIGVQLPLPAKLKV